MNANTSRPARRSESLRLKNTPASRRKDHLSRAAALARIQQAEAREQAWRDPRNW